MVQVRPTAQLPAMGQHLTEVQIVVHKNRALRIPSKAVPAEDKPGAGREARAKETRAEPMDES